MVQTLFRGRVKAVIQDRPITSGWLTLCLMGILVAVMVIEVIPR